MKSDRNSQLIAEMHTSEVKFLQSYADLKKYLPKLKGVLPDQEFKMLTNMQQMAEKMLAAHPQGLDWIINHPGNTAKPFTISPTKLQEYLKRMQPFAEMCRDFVANPVHIERLQQAAGKAFKNADVESFNMVSIAIGGVQRLPRLQLFADELSKVNAANTTIVAAAQHVSETMKKFLTDLNKSTKNSGDLLLQQVMQNIKAYSGVREDRKQGLLKVVNGIANNTTLSTEQRIVRLNAALSGELKGLNKAKSSHFFSRPGNYTKMLESALQDLNKYKPQTTARPIAKQPEASRLPPKPTRPLPPLPDKKAKSDTPPQKPLPPLITRHEAEQKADSDYSLLVHKFMEVETKRRQLALLENRLNKMINSVAEPTQFRPEAPPRKEPGHNSFKTSEVVGASKRYREKIHGLDKDLLAITDRIVAVQYEIDSRRTHAPENLAPVPPPRPR